MVEVKIPEDVPNVEISRRKRENPELRVPLGRKTGFGG